MRGRDARRKKEYRERAAGRKTFSHKYPARKDEKGGGAAGAPACERAAAPLRGAAYKRQCGGTDSIHPAALLLYMLFHSFIGRHDAFSYTL